jgi:SAM-dependent methyltransferase
MDISMKISENIQQKLICPSTKSKLKKENQYLVSVIDPTLRYPIIDDIPILIDDKKSLFSVQDFEQKLNTTFDFKKQSKIEKILRKLIPSISANIKSEKNYNKICDILPDNSVILIIGGSVKWEWLDSIYLNKSFDIVSSDVSFGPYTTLICDAHDLPFDNGVFDCVIIQAVLEHVLEPIRCVSEIYRVLKPSGLVYAETPFMQQVHMKQYDFTRFTHLGHRRLFRCFEEIDSGPTCWPGMALAWSYTYFLRSFSLNRIMRLILTIFAHFTAFFLKYFDYYLIDKPGSYDAASGLFFMGRKSIKDLSDRDLIQQFKWIR